VADVANVAEENDPNPELPLPLQFTRFFEALYYGTLSVSYLRRRLSNGLNCMQ
jgi:hypothetical protein